MTHLCFPTMWKTKAKISRNWVPPSWAIADFRPIPSLSLEGFIDVIRNYLKWQKPSFKKNVVNVYVLVWSMSHLLTWRGRRGLLPTLEPATRSRGFDKHYMLRISETLRLTADSSDARSCRDRQLLWELLLGALEWSNRAGNRRPARWHSTGWVSWHFSLASAQWEQLFAMTVLATGSGSALPLIFDFTDLNSEECYL